MDILHAIFGSAALLLAGTVFFLYRTRLPLQAQIGSLQKELEALRTLPIEQEYRIEQHDLLWYPALTYSPIEKKIIKTQVGMPFCPKCTVKMGALDSKEWCCPQCGKRAPESVTDITVLDSIEKRARGYFLARRPEYASFG